MALVTAAATVAATAATSLYLDGKYGLMRDLRGLQAQRNVLKITGQAVKEKRLSLYYLFEESVKRRLNDECIWSREGCYTWQQAYDRVHQYSQWFLLQGVKPGDLVAFYLINSADFVMAWAGLWAIGAAPAMINYHLAGTALIHCLKLSGAKLLLVDEDPELLARINDERKNIEKQLLVKIALLDKATKKTVQEMLAERPSDALREGVKIDSPTCIFYTSGTTGMPKGVVFSIARGFSAGASYKAGSTVTDDSDRWYTCMPLYHGTGGVIAMSNLMSGVTCCIGKKFSTSKFWTDIRDSRATWFTYVGETARYLLAAPPSPLDKVHNVRGMYGNGLRPDVWIKFRERFGVPEVFEFFNSSEGVFQLAVHARGDYLAGCVGYFGAIARYLNKGIYVPVLIDQASGAIARDPKTGFAIRQPYETGGEMLVAVPDTAAFAGYFNNPAATAKKFERDVFKKGDLFYRSGDALRRTSDGKWLFMDRLGDTFRWKGENVSTAEVAEVLGKYPGVVEANVYGIQVPSHDGRAGCAAVFIDPTHAATFDFADLLRYSRKHLPKYAVPVFIRVVKEMTPIHNNKQNKVPLRAEGVDPTKVNPEDKVLWIDENGKGSTYVDFHQDHWEQLKLGRTML